MATKKTKAKPSSDVSFEENLEVLETIVMELERGELSLDDAMLRYETGIKRLRACHQALEQVERKIELLAGVRADGSPITEPFDEAEETLETKQANRARRRSTEPPTSHNDDDNTPRLF